MKKELKIYNGEIIGTTYDLVLDSILLRDIGHVFPNSYYHDFMEKIKNNRVSSSLKDEALSMIREAILVNSQERCQKPIYLNYVCFGLGAPDSYELLLEYYSSLYECCLKQKDLCGISMGVYGKFYKKPHLLKNSINRMKVLSLLTMGDMLLDKSGLDVMKDFKLSLGDVDTLYSYLEKVQDEDKVRELRVDTFKRVYHEVIGGRDIDFILNKYQVKFNKLVILMRNYLGNDAADSIVSVKKQEDALKLNNQKQQFEKITKLIFDGINNPDMLEKKFTALDYFVFSRENPRDLFNFMRDFSYEDYLKLKPKFVLKKEKYYICRAIMVKNLLEYLTNFNIYNKDRNFDYFTRNNSFVITQNDKKYFLNDYIEQIFELFDKKAIPKSRETVDVAFHRLINKLPIFPFEQVFSDDKNVLPTSDKLEVCNGYIVECCYDVVFDNFVKLSGGQLIKNKDYLDFLAIVSNNKVSDDLKNRALSMIRKAISINNQENCQSPVCLNYVCFGLGAPDAYGLVNDYYDSLYKCCLKQKELFGITNGIVGEYYGNPHGLESKINSIKVSSLLAMINTTSSKNGMEIMEEVKLPFKYLKLYYSYMNNINNSINWGYSVSVDENVRNLFRGIYKEIVNGCPISFIEDKYNMSFKALIECVRRWLGADVVKEIKRIAKDGSDVFKNEKKEVYEEISKMMIDSRADNFIVNDKIVRFSILDYFTKTADSPFKFREFLKKFEYEDYLKVNPKIILPRRNYYVIRAIVIKELMELGRNYTSYRVSHDYDDFVKQNICVQKGNGDEYNLEDYLDEIFRVFAKKNIPCSNRNVEIAFYRLCDDIAILPFEDEEARGKILKP